MDFEFTSGSEDDLQVLEEIESDHSMLEVTTACRPRLPI